jgi:hypothetical protein
VQRKWEKSAQRRTEKVPQTTGYPRHGPVPTIIALPRHFDVNEPLLCPITPERVFVPGASTITNIGIGASTDSCPS